MDIGMPTPPLPPETREQERARCVAGIAKANAQIASKRAQIGTLEGAIRGHESFKEIFAREHGFELAELEAEALKLAPAKKVQAPTS